MRWQHCFGSLVLAGVAVIGLVASGCTKNDPAAKDKGKTTTAKTTEKDDHKDHKEAKADPKKGDHSGWWCQEHGIPEHLCSMCSDEVAAKHKKDGDWCKIHDRAKSQCFKCEPGLYRKFEEMYVAKYNKKPEPPPKGEFEK
jgi:hypothetical protein